MGRQFRNKLVPGLSARLKRSTPLACNNAADGTLRGQASVAPRRLRRGSSHHPHRCSGWCRPWCGYVHTLVKIFQEIGERVDHEIFLRLVKEIDPNGWERVDRWVLRKTEKGYANKIRTSQGLTDVTDDYEFLESDDAVKFGTWCFDALVDHRLVEKVLWVTGSGKKRRTQYYLGLSEEGLKYRDIIEASADEQCFEAWPMLTSFGVGPGKHRSWWLRQPHPGQISRLILTIAGPSPL